MTRALALTTVALVAAVVLAPELLATLLVGDVASVGALRDSLPAAFADHWRAGDGAVSGALADAVRYWTAFHVVKALAAGALLAVLVVALDRLRRGPGRVALLALAALAAVVLVANVQGAVAPLSSLLSMLPAGAADLALASSGTAAFSALVRDFASYHLAMVGLAGAAAVVVGRLGVRAARHGRRAAAGGAVVPVVLLGVVTLANASTVAAPEPALRGFLQAAAAQR
ncbi:hypothetical protein [Nocardioides daeguensis]|uniref:Uncharacterized protein n=1 Tax=Nocardioides daeguensis TaxID=908359 RepID=A0ABP6VAH9_9ACTN|nr:hypothetical protein [Nocardioides daeguensis]MBV6726038.1 hypothetical protein [Nocardioides daeguensis]MCR1771881.1 hypothetical protein [Nocardioides daeguensis]